MSDTFSRYKLGRKCPFCDSTKLYKTADGRLKCSSCCKYFSLAKLRKDLTLLYYFYLETSARKTAQEMGIKVHGTIGILMRNFREGKIRKNEAIEKLHLLKKIGFFITNELIDNSIKAIENYPKKKN